MPSRLDLHLEQAFADAARRDSITPDQALHDLVTNYVRDSLRKEARRHSRLIARAPDSAETDTLMRAVQNLDDD